MEGGKGGGSEGGRDKEVGRFSSSLADLAQLTHVSRHRLEVRASWSGCALTQSSHGAVAASLFPIDASTPSPSASLRQPCFSESPFFTLSSLSSLCLFLMNALLPESLAAFHRVRESGSKWPPSLPTVGGGGSVSTEPCTPL